MSKMAAILTSIIIVVMALPNFSYSQEKLGLIIIAHGSPMHQWNAPVLTLEEEVRNVMSEKANNRFSSIRVAFMEFNEPSINSVIKDLEGVGIGRVFVLPLFIAPSGHSLYDVPAILGLYSDKKLVECLKEEGIAIVDTRMKITVGPTLNAGDILKEVILDRVKELSTEPDSESVVLLAHGSDPFEPVWGSMCREIGSYICAKTGVKFFDYAFVEIGQSFISNGMPVILRTAKKTNNTLVVGVYISMGVENMAQNSAITIGRMKIESKEVFAGRNIRFAKRGLLPDERVSEWIADRAMEWVKTLQ